MKGAYALLGAARTLLFALFLSNRSLCSAFQLPSLTAGWPFAASTSVGERNGLDSEYPWRFEGRFIFRPSLVRVPDAADAGPKAASLLQLFGFSLGGSVALEYDVSPVGPYREYVDMGGLVALGGVDVGSENRLDSRSLVLGQWGSNLYVSTKVAEDVCRQVWGVPAEVANIDFEESGSHIIDGPDDEQEEDGPDFFLRGWQNTRMIEDNGEKRRSHFFRKIPVFWTPTIKALWAPLLLPGGSSQNTLPLHRLRLSAGRIQIQPCARRKPKDGEIPLGLALVVDNALIEIAEREQRI